MKRVLKDDLEILTVTISLYLKQVCDFCMHLTIDNF